MEKHLLSLTRRRSLRAFTVAAVPVAAAALVMLDQSMRRPSLAALVMQSLHFAM